MPGRRKVNRRAMEVHKVKPSPIRRAQLPLPDANTFNSAANINDFAARRAAAKGLQQVERNANWAFDPVSMSWEDPATAYYQRSGTQPIVSPTAGYFNIPNDKMRQYIYRQQRQRTLNPMTWIP